MIRTATILLLLAATAAHAQLTTTVKRIRLEYATEPELAASTLEFGHVVVNEENLADLRIGDGATPGGVRVGSDWWTNNMLSAWGGLSRVDVEALVALSIGNLQEKDAAALSAVAAVSGRVDVVEGWGDHGEAGYALSSALLGYLPSAQAATQYLSVTSAAADYLPLSGYDGLVVLGTRTRGYAASTNLGEYGFAAGYGTSAGDAGFAAGSGTSASEGGFAAGFDTSAGDAGFAAGAGTSAGNYGFAAGRAAKGADGSFVFADNSGGGTPFNRTDIPDSFSLRVAGGAHFLIGTNWLTATNDAQTNLVLSVPGTVSAGSFVAAAGATNLFIRPDGGTNAIYFDSSSNMVIAVDGSPALTISPAGDVGVGTTPSASFSLRTDASLYAGGQVRAGSYVMAGNGQVFLNSAGTSWLQLDGTNLTFRATNGVTGRIQMIYE